MSRARWWVVGIVAVVVAAVGAVVAWRQADGDDEQPGLAATLTRIRLDSSPAYAFPVWWTDGRTPVKLGDVDGQLRILDPVAEWEHISDPRADIELPGGSGTHPAAFAALPGKPDGPWVAVSLPAKDVSLNDLKTTERPLAWTGPTLATDDDAPAGKPSELPVTLRSNESNGAIALVDAAVARLGSEDVAVVTTKQRDNDRKVLDEASVSVCRLSDCHWRGGAFADNTAIELIGSTGDGFVALTDSETAPNAIWWADDPELTWRRIGSAPRGTNVQLIQDGAGTATLMSSAKGGVAIQTVRRGKLRNAVPLTRFDGPRSAISTAIQRKGTWYLGGSRPSTARLALPYGAPAPMLWERRDKTWRAIDDALLENQPAQEIEVLFTDRESRLRAMSSSPVQRIYMTWRFSRPKG